MKRRCVKTWWQLLALPLHQKEDMQSEEDEPFKAAKSRLDRILRVYGYVFAAV
jgi:hypothetical protein